MGELLEPGTTVKLNVTEYTRSISKHKGISYRLLYTIEKIHQNKHYVLKGFPDFIFYREDVTCIRNIL